IRTWGEAVAQIGLFNVNIVNSGNPEMERKISSKFSYGRQLGRMLDVLAPLVEANRDQLLKTPGFNSKDLDDFEEMVKEIKLAKK
ncbi:MAG: hypothetical protein ACHP7O_12725, partial [Burkholderiales bacterium]